MDCYLMVSLFIMLVDFLGLDFKGNIYYYDLGG